MHWPERTHPESPVHRTDARTAAGLHHASADRTCPHLAGNDGAIDQDDCPLDRLRGRKQFSQGVSQTRDDVSASLSGAASDPSGIRVAGDAVTKSYFFSGGFSFKKRSRSSCTE